MVKTLLLYPSEVLSIAEVTLLDNWEQGSAITILARHPKVLNSLPPFALPMFDLDALATSDIDIDQLTIDLGTIAYRKVTPNDGDKEVAALEVWLAHQLLDRILVYTAKRTEGRPTFEGEDNNAYWKSWQKLDALFAAAASTTPTKLVLKVCDSADCSCTTRRFGKHDLRITHKPKVNEMGNPDLAVEENPLKKKKPKKKPTSIGTTIATFPSFFHLPIRLIRCMHLATFDFKEYKSPKANSGHGCFKKNGFVRPERWCTAEQMWLETWSLDPVPAADSLSAVLLSSPCCPHPSR